MAKLIDSLNDYSVTPGYASASVVLLSPNSGNTKDLIGLDDLKEKLSLFEDRDVVLSENPDFLFCLSCTVL